MEIPLVLETSRSANFNQTANLHAMKETRRDFIKKSAMLTAGLSIASTASSYNRIMGANDRVNVAIVGLGRRLGAYPEPIAMKESNARLLYLCDVMASQREKAASRFEKVIDYKPKLENSILRVLEDSGVDVIINATPDHWHAPGSWLAAEAGKHVYVEKPCSHNPKEGEILIEASNRYGKVIQMGNQQRSAGESIEIIKAIHEGAIGETYLAIAFYSNRRGKVVNQSKAEVPVGLDWELWQGPAPRRDYTHNTWDYNWHWYGWDYGTAETGNNATHELDVARWALQVDYPSQVFVDASKRHFLDDGWEMYDTMDATFTYDNGKTIKWDGKSRNGFNTYGGGRGTIIYGTKGSVHMDRGGYRHYDRDGNLVKEQLSGGSEGGIQLGGGGNMSTNHVFNFFEAIRGKQEQRAPITEGHISTMLCHYANIAYRIGDSFECDPKTGRIYNREAMELWSRTYEPGWEPKIG